jgi:hypothetical protein
VSDTSVKQQLTIACLETMRLLENIRVSSDSRIVSIRIDSGIKELNGMLTQLDNEVTIEVLKSLAARINEMHKEIIDDAAS